MALVFLGKTPCVLCGQAILRQEDVISFPAFLPKEHRFQQFSDAVFHVECFKTWPDREDFEWLYKKYRAIWDSRPNLKTLQEMEAWGKEAFKDLYTDGSCK